ncbi:MAG TPA: hypothetical protein VJA19_18810, partial [Pseudomonas sp.]|nr:hypothetical protein [Pseudomonas sp.]
MPNYAQLAVLAPAPAQLNPLELSGRSRRPGCADCQVPDYSLPFAVLRRAKGLLIMRALLSLLCLMLHAPSALADAS